ncbi:hypothetical protein [Agromyces albus]|uniref:hypothetical protein n=1 Tax=Agromyces albus TaxID=205332 RepID=UPI0027D92D64|nr:hypothetical protein [Agromyces albus]
MRIRDPYIVEYDDRYLLFGTTDPSPWHGLVVALILIPFGFTVLTAFRPERMSRQIFTTDPTVLFPAALLGAAPLLIVFMVFQRHVVAGLTMGAVKS